MSDVVDRVSRRYRLQSSEGRSIAFWGVILLSVTEGVLFINLLFSYFYLWSVSTEWPPADVHPPTLGWMIAIRTGALLCSSLTIWFAERALGAGRRGAVWVWTSVTVLLAGFFLVTHVQEFLRKPSEFLWSDHAYGSLYYTILNFHGAHVAVGVAIWLFVLVRLGRGAYGPGAETQFNTAAIYWHFVDAVWVLVFATMYLFPNLLPSGP